MNEINNPPMEIERKYLIQMPQLDVLEQMPNCRVDEIQQIYLTSEGGTTHRIRRRTGGGRCVYTETIKVRVDRMSCMEYEREIQEPEYNALAQKRDPQTRPITKTRYTFLVDAQSFEIDVYPFWSQVAVLETELKTRDTEVVIPPCIRVLRELTGDRRFSNAAISKQIPTAPDLV